MKEIAKIEGTAEAWENRELGCDETFAQLSKLTESDQNAIDEALDLQMISIRLQKGLLESLKAIASLNGIGYQPLIKQVLQRFVDGEMKMIAMEYAKQLEAQRKEFAQKEVPKKDEKTAAKEKRCA